MYYVGAYGEESNGNIEYRFVGWSKNKLAVSMYNIAGHNCGSFYDHYEIFEYDCDKEDFIIAIQREWDENITDWENNENYIDIYETRWGDYLSITNVEYCQLVQWTDIEYEMGKAYMQTLYNIIGANIVPLIRNEEIGIFIGYLAATYIDIFKGIDSKGSMELSERIDKLQAFICRVRDDTLMNIY